jgi:hypothetical protein
MFMNIPHTRTNNNFRCLSYDRLPLYSDTISLCFCSMYNCFLSKISGFCHRLDENCTLLGYYTASSANLLLTCQYKVLVPSSGFKNPKDIMGSIHCPKTLIRNYNCNVTQKSTVFNCFSSLYEHLTRNTSKCFITTFQIMKHYYACVDALQDCSDD